MSTIMISNAMSFEPPFKLTIPDSLPFSELQLRLETNGTLSINVGVMAEIWVASGLDADLLEKWTPDNMSELIWAWYDMHLAAGGAKDPVAEELLIQARKEKSSGIGYSMPYGHA